MSEDAAPDSGPSQRVPAEPSDEAGRPDVARARTNRPLDPHPSRSTTVAVGALVVVAFGFLLVRGPRRERSAPMPVVAAESAAPSAESGEEKLQKAMTDLQSLPPNQTTDGLTKILEALDDVGPSNVGRKMPDGTDPPPLPPSAPRRVGFGVVLVRYKGAQLAPSAAIAKEDALARAKLLAQVAKSDFAGAVKEGDPGSTVDIGTVRRGVLEPATEYVLFTLPVGWVSDVLDTPRGFWVVKRIR